MKKGWICGIIAVVLNLLLGLILVLLSKWLLTTGPDAETVALCNTGMLLGKFYIGLTVANALVVFWASKKKAGSVFLIIVGVLSFMSGVGFVAAILNIVAATGFNSARKQAKLEAEKAELQAKLDAAQQSETVAE